MDRRYLNLRRLTNNQPLYSCSFFRKSLLGSSPRKHHLTPLPLSLPAHTHTFTHTHLYTHTHDPPTPTPPHPPGPFAGRGGGTPWRANAGGAAARLLQAADVTGKHGPALLRTWRTHTTPTPTLHTTPSHTPPSGPCWTRRIISLGRFPLDCDGRYTTPHYRPHCYQRTDEPTLPAFAGDRPATRCTVDGGHTWTGLDCLAFTHTRRGFHCRFSRTLLLPHHWRKWQPAPARRRYYCSPGHFYPTTTAPLLPLVCAVYRACRITFAQPVGDSGLGDDASPLSRTRALAHCTCASGLVYGLLPDSSGCVCLILCVWSFLELGCTTPHSCLPSMGLHLPVYSLLPSWLVLLPLYQH